MQVSHYSVEASPKFDVNIVLMHQAFAYLIGFTGLIHVTTLVLSCLNCLFTENLNI